MPPCLSFCPTTTTGIGISFSHGITVNLVIISNGNWTGWLLVSPGEATVRSLFYSHYQFQSHPHLTLMAWANSTVRVATAHQHHQRVHVYLHPSYSFCSRLWLTYYKTRTSQVLLVYSLLCLVSLTLFLRLSPPSTCNYNLSASVIFQLACGAFWFKVKQSEKVEEEEEEHCEGKYNYAMQGILHVSSLRMNRNEAEHMDWYSINASSFSHPAQGSFHFNRFNN